MQKLLKKTVDIPGYKGLFCLLFTNEHLEELKLLKKDKKIQKNQKFEVVETKFKKRFEQSKTNYDNIKSKTLCPMLNNFEMMFFNESNNSNNSKEKILNLHLNELLSEPGNQKETMMDNLEIIEIEENFEIECFLTEKNESTKKNNYKVENVAEVRQLDQEILNSEFLPTHVLQNSEFPSDLQLMSMDSQSTTKNNNLPQNFNYWARLEPEKWKRKTKQATIKKR